MPEHPRIALVEVVYVDDDDAADSFTLWVTPELVLRVPPDLDEQLLARLVELPLKELRLGGAVVRGAHVAQALAGAD